MAGCGPLLDCWMCVKDIEVRQIVRRLVEAVRFAFPLNHGQSLWSGVVKKGCGCFVCYDSGC